MSNPFRREDSSSNAQQLGELDACVVVIFGATGDLTHRKLVPALYNLSVDGLLPARFYLVGAARRKLSDKEFRKSLMEGVQDHSRRKPLNKSVWGDFESHSYYCCCPFDDEEAYKSLSAQLDEIDQMAGTKCTRVFYFATSPDFFDVIAERLNSSSLINSKRQHDDLVRVIVEKPFGVDVASAKSLNRALLDCMSEKQIYRIDHYLGKETVQNLLVFRFANGIFEPIWNHKYIDHVEISVCESIGVGSRAGYFDRTGILRDIVQNHALQLLCLVALEPPVAFEADAVRDEKLKVLRSLRSLKPAEVGKKVVRARYQSGSVAGETVEGYLAEKGVSDDSSTETYLAMELEIDNWRWAGVPFYLRAGKRLSKRITEISIHFKRVPHPLFRDAELDDTRPNILSFEIQPDEGIGLRISSKPPGPEVRLQSVNMDFSYGTSFGVDPPDAYERLLLDAMRGDATLFTRDDEIEAAWEVVQPILDCWNQRGMSAPALYGYEAGSWGPVVADELLKDKVGRGWRRL